MGWGAGVGFWRLGAVVVAAMGCCAGCLAGPEERFVELAKEWREHAKSYEWNADSNWMPMNHEADVVGLEPYHELVDGTLCSLDAELWRGRNIRVLTEGQPIITKMIEASRGGPFVCTFRANDEYWLMDDSLEWSASASTCVRSLVVDAKRCYDGGDLDGAMDRLAAGFRVIGQYAEAESFLASMRAMASYQSVVKATGLLVEAWPAGGPTVEQSAELVAAIDALDPADPFGYLRALVSSAEETLAWAKATEDPAAALFSAWRANPENFAPYEIEGAPLPDAIEAFRGWLVIQWGYSRELLIYHAERQLEAVRALTAHWTTLSDDLSEPAWEKLAVNTLSPFTMHTLEIYQMDNEWMKEAWVKRSTMTDFSEALALRARLAE